jgi:hypothetical protein
MKIKLVEFEGKQDMNKELTWGPNDYKSRLGPFHALRVAGVGPKKTVSCEIRK